jgi:hypothetical protein
VLQEIVPGRPQNHFLQHIQAVTAEQVGGCLFQRLQLGPAGGHVGKDALRLLQVAGQHLAGEHPVFDLHGARAALADVAHLVGGLGPGRVQDPVEQALHLRQTLQVRESQEGGFVESEWDVTEHIH